jgi:hypothetical protein
MRDFFFVILFNCVPSVPGFLWESFRNEMTYDLLIQYRAEFNNSQLDFNDDLYNLALYLINCLLQKLGNDVSHFAGLPELRDLIQINGSSSRLIRDELAYDSNQLNSMLTEDLPKLNVEQITHSIQ